MNFEFTEYSWKDFAYWIETDAAMAQLLQYIKKSPFQGIGKPEPLKYSLKGY